MIAAEVTLAPEKNNQADTQTTHQKQSPPQSVFIVKGWKVLEVHAKESCDEVQWQEDGRQHGESAHDFVGAVALRIEVHLHRGLCTLL